MTALILIVIVGACVAYQYFKGSVVKAGVTVILVISSGIIAFAYFEQAAGLLTPHLMPQSGKSVLVVWLKPICFSVLFVFPCVILLTIAGKLIHKSIELSELVNRIGRCVLAVIYGYILTGFLLTALAMAPLPKKIPYQRFDSADPQRANSAFLSPDSFVSGLFSAISRGSMSGQTSFAVIHPSFIDESYLNRYELGDMVTLISRGSGIDIKGENAVYPAPDNLKDKEGNIVTAAGGNILIVVKVEININSGDFTFSQMRLICNDKTNINTPFKGAGINVYPMGYITSAGEIETKSLGQVIKISSKGRIFEMVFEVPNDYFPVLLAFKQNNLLKVPRISNPAEITEDSGESD